MVSGCRSGCKPARRDGHTRVRYVENVVSSDCDRGSHWACDEPAPSFRLDPRSIVQRAGERAADARGLPDHPEGQQGPITDQVAPGSKPSRAAKAGPARVIGNAAEPISSAGPSGRSASTHAARRCPRSRETACVRPGTSGRDRSRSSSRSSPDSPSTTTFVPGSSDSLVKPRRNRTFGVPASNAQFSHAAIRLLHVHVEPHVGIDPLHLR